MGLIRNAKQMLERAPGTIRQWLKRDKRKRKRSDPAGPSAQGVSIETNDRTTLEFVNEVLRFVKDRDLLLKARREMMDQLDHLQYRVQVLTQEKDKFIYQFLDKEEEIKAVEQRLADKHVQYDQLLQDYLHLESSTASEIRELKSALDEERRKYDRLADQFRATRDEPETEKDGLQDNPTE